MLALGLVVGAFSLWLLSRTKLRYEFERGRAEGDTERATLIERLSGKEGQLRDAQESLDRERDERAGASGMPSHGNGWGKPSTISGCSCGEFKSETLI